MSHYFFNWLILEAKAEIQKKSSFGSNENFEICFWGLLTFDSVSVTRGFDEAELAAPSTLYGLPKRRNEIMDLSDSDDITTQPQRKL